MPSPYKVIFPHHSVTLSSCTSPSRPSLWTANVVKNDDQVMVMVVATDAMAPLDDADAGKAAAV
jgi:hypothetical protein